MRRKVIYAWACDYTKFSGEGNLARKFVKDLLKYNHKVKIKSDLSLGKKKLRFIDKYFSPFLGIIFCWKHFLQGHQTCYLNYLPLWNFLIFFLLPPKTIIGPITGGANYNSDLKFQYIVRKFFFPIFFKISELLIIIRYKKFLFSTSLLKNNLSQKTIQNSFFDYAFSNLTIFKYKKKEIDFVIYYRKNKNKKSFFSKKILQDLAEFGYKIKIVGDRLNFKFVENCGFLNFKKLNRLLSKTKFTIASGENIYSFFSIDCIRNHVIIFVDKSQNNSNKSFDHFFKKINFEKIVAEVRKTKLKKIKKIKLLSMNLNNFFEFI